MADLIERDVVAYKLKSCITIPADSEWDSGYNTAMAEAKQYIQNAPAVNRWIPCSERLPDREEDVLVWFEYFRYGEYNCLYQTYGIGNYFSHHDNWLIDKSTGWRDLRVIAWMPLPEPPERSDTMTNGEIIRYSDYDSLAAFLHRMQAGAIIKDKADSEETLREWLDEDAEYE